MISKFGRSLEDLLGAPYCRAASNAAKACGLEGDFQDIMSKKIPFVTDQFLASQDRLLGRIGEQIIDSLADSPVGAASDSFRRASHLKASPLGGVGFIRIGEDGRCYLSAKSEHYHASLGHNFPGYRLLSTASDLGITNVTHNNTRGFITRILEQRLIDLANHQPSNDDPRRLERIINLETGSLAVEAGVKMMLARFYRQATTKDRRSHPGKTPVFFVMGDLDGGKTANYHGTTLITQLFRDLWPDFGGLLDKAAILKIVPVRINDAEDFQAKIDRYNSGDYKVAGFLHEIILMNYGAMVLDRDYLSRVYDLCHAGDIPILVDEIQSGIWYADTFLFRKYGLSPDLVAVGKGFPGGQYPGSKIIATAEMDSLDQFGALVTNGQEELASLSYLITMEFAAENADHIRSIGTYYEESLAELRDRHSTMIAGIEGLGLLSAIRFFDIDTAVSFAKVLNDRCVDVSVHTYKPKCPPTALTKLPLVATERMVDVLVGHFDDVLGTLSSSG